MRKARANEYVEMSFCQTVYLNNGPDWQWYKVVLNRKFYAKFNVEAFSRKQIICRSVGK